MRRPRHAASPAAVVAAAAAAVLALATPATTDEQQSRAAAAASTPSPTPPELTPARLKTAARVWREFAKDPRNGIDLVYDCIRAYPDAQQVLGSLARETGLPMEKVRHALGPLGLNLLLSYTKVLTVARSPDKLRRYAATMRRLYREKDIPEREYAMLNDVIGRHVRLKVQDSFSPRDARAPWEVLDAVRAAIFGSAPAPAVVEAGAPFTS